MFLLVPLLRGGGVSGVLVDLMFFRICFVGPFTLVMEGGRFFIRSTVRLGHVDKWPFLVAWSKFLRTGLKIVAWYFLAIYGLIITDRGY